MKGLKEQMTKKYIIWNCPAYDKFLQEPTCNKYSCDCQTKTDCLIKQVVETCKKYNSDLALTGYQQGKEDVAYEILQLFEIEVVNNDG